MDVCIFFSHISVVRRLDWVRLAVRAPDPTIAVMVARHEAFRTASEIVRLILVCVSEAQSELVCVSDPCVAYYEYLV